MENMLSRLSQREQNMVSVAAIFLILFIVIRFTFLPAIDKRQSLSNQIDAKKDILKQMSQLAERYEQIQTSLNAEKLMVMKRDKSFSLFSFLDKLAQQSNVKENVAYMKPSTRKSENGDMTISTVKVKLDGVVIKQVLDFIYKIESSENFVYIPSLSISKTGDGQNLSAIIETETISSS